MSERTRRVAAIARSGHVQVQREPVPAPEEGCILVRVRASLISPGTEIGVWAGKSRPDTPEPPFRTFGYQNAGEILEVGPGCEGFQVGQRVACMGAGYAVHGDLALVPQYMATALPEGVAEEEGAFCALAATAMQAARRGDIAFGEDVGVIGLGLVGQLTAQVCAAAGARVMAFDPLAMRAERARRCGVDLAYAETGRRAEERVHELTGGRGLDCAFLCLGGDATAALESAVSMMQLAPDSHRMGRIVLVGGASVTHAFGAALGNLDLRSAARTGPGYYDPAYERQGGYPDVFVRWTTRAHLELFTRWLIERKLRVRELITGRFPIEQADKACYALMDAPGYQLGVVLTYDQAASGTLPAAPRAVPGA